MPEVTYTQVRDIITKNNRLFIPDAIEDAILNCIAQDIGTVKQTGDEIIEAFSPVDHAVTLEYDRPEVVDAYSLYYMRRNTLIPRIAIRDIVLNNNLQTFPEQMKILDIGSGTGAVTIGLLEMFLHPPLNTIDIHVDAIDVSKASLERLRCHLKESGLSGFSVNTVVQDIRDVASLESFLATLGPYNLIFAANVFNELEHSQSCDILCCLSKYLADTAVIVIANAQRDFIKELQSLLVTEAYNNGLFVYYPCPMYDTSEHDCWFWREHDYSCRRVRTKSGQFILPSHRDQLVDTWLILCNRQLSIFDDFRSNYPHLEWGVFQIRGKDSRNSMCEVCTGHGRIILGHQQESYKRGAIVGYESNPLRIRHYIEL